MKNNDFDIIVVGGGPAGCTAAAYLARDGHKVCLIEKQVHPRHRIGESLLPSMMPILVDFGLIGECERRGFTKKSGATFTWGKSQDPWHLRWSENPFLPHNSAYHVERSSFDEMLSLYARSVGVDVREDTKVTEPIFADASKKKIIGVNWESDGKTGQLHSRWVVDCSGAGSVIGKAMSTRKYDDKMNQVAFYSYFDNVHGPEASEAEGIHEHIVITTCPKGWFWWIPINSEKMGAVSCGLVSGQEFKDEFSNGSKGAEEFFYKALADCPRVQKMMGSNPIRRQPFRSVVDWSYSCEITAGDGFFLCGDAAAFLDPLISTGVSLAMLSAFSASICINTIMKNPGSEAAVTNFYQKNYRQMYEVTRDFLHYFYAGASTKYPDELFWKGRKNLRVGENVGAKQAFTFFTAIIPGNPHPAVGKQISLFKNMMNNVEHPKEKLETEFREKEKWANIKEISASEVQDDTRLVVNGTFEKSYTIDGKSRQLIPMWGVSYDKERPVLSNTASWLMGENFLGVEQEMALVLKHLDGQKTWAEVQRAVRAEDSKVSVAGVLEKLCQDRIVLKSVS